MRSGPGPGRRRMCERPESVALPAGVRRSDGRFLLPGVSGRARRPNLQGADERPDVPRRSRRPDSPERANDNLRQWRAPRRARQLSRADSPGLPSRRDARFVGPLRWFFASPAADNFIDAERRAERSPRRRQAPATGQRGPADGAAPSRAARRRAPDQATSASSAYSVAAPRAAPCRTTDAAREALQRNALLITSSERRWR